MSHTCLFHISPNHYPPLPAQHHTRRIWDELSKDFDEYHVVARGEGNCYVHSIDGKIHLHLLPAFGKRMWPFFFLSWVLPLLVVRYKPTHLLAQCPVLGGLAASFCSKCFHVPLFVELHGRHYFSPARLGWQGRIEHLLYRRLSRITFWAASRIRSLSDDMHDRVLQVYGPRAYRKVVVVPNRVDLQVFRYVKDSYSADRPIRVITIGNYSRNKNHCALIEDLCKAGIDFRLTIVGAGALKKEYWSLANRLNVADKIETVYLNHKSLASLLPHQDIYVHYSLSEGVPRAILEAMAAGLPVITTRVGFIGGVLVDGENAIVIDKPFAERLVKTIRLLADSEDLRRRLGVAARNTIETRFEWNLVFDKYRSAIRTMGLETL